MSWIKLNNVLLLSFPMEKKKLTEPFWLYPERFGSSLSQCTTDVRSLHQLRKCLHLYMKGNRTGKTQKTDNKTLTDCPEAAELQAAWGLREVQEPCQRVLSYTSYTQRHQALHPLSNWSVKLLTPQLAACSGLESKTNHLETISSR